MPQDYARPKRPKKTAAQNRRSPSGPRKSGWTLLLSGFVTGVLVSALSVYWYVNQPLSVSNANIDETEQADAKPRFDFYTLLKESEVFVPEVEESPQNQTPSEQYHYLLQAGSFRRYADADGLRAQLLLLNLDAAVETTGAKPGETWHRVLVGPFTSRSKAANARAALLQNGIDNLLLKRKRG
ncbi:MAG: SPOR domain-containing protein [Porticoccaceae bacterium]